MSETGDAVDAAAVDLYVLPPEDFTAARNARAKDATGPVAAGIKALRKPAVAAWAVNLLVRDGQLAEAVELAAALREAQDELDAKELTELGRQRRQLVASLARRAVELAREQGTQLSPSVRDAVSNTINAAVVDAAAAAAVLTGRLLKPIDPGDLDGVFLLGLVAGSEPDGTPPASPPARNDLAERRARKAAEAAARAAESASSQAKRELARVQTRHAEAREHANALGERLEELRAELDRVAQEARDADADLQKLGHEQARAQSRAEEAAREAERARAAVPRG
jgi:hypothetical protein